MSVSNIVLSGNTSNHKGALQVPRLTAIEKTTLTAAKGMILYLIDTNTLEYYDGTQWQDIAVSVTTVTPSFFMFPTLLEPLIINTNVRLGQTVGNTILHNNGFTYDNTDQTMVCTKNGIYNIEGCVALNGLSYQNGAASSIIISITQDGVDQVSNTNSSTNSFYPETISYNVSGLLYCLVGTKIGLLIKYTGTNSISAQINGGILVGYGYESYLCGYYAGTN